MKRLTLLALAAFFTFGLCGTALAQEGAEPPAQEAVKKPAAKKKAKKKKAEPPSEYKFTGTEGTAPPPAYKFDKQAEPILKKAAAKKKKPAAKPAPKPAPKPAVERPAGQNIPKNSKGQLVLPPEPPKKEEVY